MIVLLIDAYNLLYAVGWANPNMSLTQWNQARRRFLDWLADQQNRHAAQATFRVVLDAQNRRTAIEPEVNQAQLELVWKLGESADDLIEAELRKLKSGQTRVIVVSNDHRLRDAAKRLGMRYWSSTDFLDWLERGPVPTATAAETVEKPESLPDSDDLLRIFSEAKPRSHKKTKGKP